MGETSTPSVPGDVPPDWGATAEEVHCPLCGYDLRGLVEPRCPECGYAFTWAGLFEARRTVHPYLFEHHPKRNVWSFVRTTAAGLVPRRFWRTLTAAHPIRLRRLVLYWVLACVPLGAVLGAYVGRSAWLFYDKHRQTPAAVLNVYRSAVVGTTDYADRQEIVKQYGSVEAYVRQHYYIPTVGDSAAAGFSEHRPLVVAYGLWALWPWATGAVLLVYRRSMHQAAIRPGHVARCVVYGSDVVWWVGVPVLAVLCWRWGWSAWEYRAYGMAWLEMAGEVPRWVLAWMPWVWHGLAAVAAYRVVVAYREYLRFRGARAAVLLASVASLLLVWVLYLWLAGETGMWALWW